MQSIKWISGLERQIYWPGISEDIKATYHRCAKFARTQQKEILPSVKRCQSRWEQLGLDIFSLRNIHYLLIVDYFSQFPTVRKLLNLHSMSVIKHLKEIFTEIGLPRCIVSDGGTQFTSQEFKDFTKMWGTQHRITSPINMHSLMDKQSILSRQSRIVSPKSWKEGKTYT